MDSFQIKPLGRKEDGYEEFLGISAVESILGIYASPALSHSILETPGM